MTQTIKTYATGRWLPTAKTQTLTKALLVAGGIGYLLYDIFAYKNAKNDAISPVSMAEMYSHPAYTLMLGALMGHLTWPQFAARAPAQSLKVVLPVMLGLGAWDHYFPVQHPVWPIWPFMAGIPVGHFVFAQDETTLAALRS